MKIYSDNAVTANVVNELDAKQSREIEKLKTYCLLLLVGNIATLGITIALHLAN